VLLELQSARPATARTERLGSAAVRAPAAVGSASRMSPARLRPQRAAAGGVRGQRAGRKLAVAVNETSTAGARVALRAGPLAEGFRGGQVHQEMPSCSSRVRNSRFRRPRSYICPSVQTRALRAKAASCTGGMSRISA
jgi:hypothetical protein